MAILHPTEAEFNELMNESGVLFVDFYADWCGPCKMLAPLVEQLDKEYEGKIKIAKIDVDKETGLAMRFGVNSIPTVIIFKDGLQSATEIGFKPIDAYKGIIDSLI